MSIEKSLEKIKSALTTTKMLQSTQEKMNKTEFNDNLVDLMDSLVAAKKELVEIKNELIDKEEDIKFLKSKLEEKATVSFEDPFYWKITEDVKEGPFCPKCYDGENKLSRILDKTGYSKGSHQCSVCDKWYGEGTNRTISR